MKKPAALLVIAFTATVSAQPAARRATNIAALLTHPEFYHLRSVVIVGEVKRFDSGELRVSTDAGSLPIVFKGSAPDGLDEVRGEFWDLGRMNAGDPRLAAYDVNTTFKIDPNGPWPRPGQIVAIVAASVASAAVPPAPSIRNIALYPSRYADQRVTVTGQFGGRNLLGDLPDAPAQSRYDFVLRSADAAIWVTHLRPRGKDFELALDARIDTGRWLEVSGTLQQGRGLQWLDASAGTLALTQPPKEAPKETQIKVAPAPPPEVVFSAPIADETDVALNTTVRIQFSRDIDPSTFKGRVAATYGQTDAREPGEAAAPPVAFTTQYLPGTRVLELRFANPLERFRTVMIELHEGILGTDKQPLAPWKLAFQTGP
jgi:hypothetical protein